MAKNSIEKEISDLERAINSPATPEAQKKIMRNVLEKLKSKQSSAPSKKTETKEVKTDKKSDEKNFDKKVFTFLSKNYPRYTDELLMEDNQGEELSDEDYNYYFDLLVDALREEFDEMNDDKGGDSALANDYVEDYMSNPPKKKAEPKSESKTEKPTSEDDYDCDTLIEKERKRREKIKERAIKKASEPKTTQATKNKDAIEKVGDKLEASIEKRLETGKVSKSELTKLIDETKALLKMLESYLDKVK